MKSMTEHRETFKREQGKLEEIIEHGKLADNRENPNAIVAHRSYAGQLASEMSGQRVAIDDNVSEPAVAHIYVAGISEANDKASGYFHDNKSHILDEIEDSKLAEKILGVEHVKTGDAKYDKRVDAINEYRTISTINQTFDNDIKLPDGKKITHKDLVRIAAGYVQESVQKRYDAGRKIPK